MGKKSEWLFKTVAELLRGREGKATDRTRLESSRNRSMKEPGLPHISDSWSGTERAGFQTGNIGKGAGKEACEGQPAW